MTPPLTRLPTLLLATAALALLVLLATNGPRSNVKSEATQIERARTDAVGTFMGDLTETALSRPSSTPSFTPRPASTVQGTASGSATAICLGLRFIRDVTIPDNTEMTPAQVFTKTWLVENSGTCPWKPGFQVILIGGLALGGSPFKVSQTVGPGGSIQVSIKMVAPTNASGVVQGTWKMADETGAAFGDYLSAVIVVQAPTLRAAPSPTVASTPTP